MTTLYENAVPIINLPFFYINGAILSNDATTPNSKLDLSAGLMRDSTNTYDMNIGNYNGQVNPSASANVSTTIDCGVNGLNGLDTGSLGASHVYYIYVVSDPVSGNPSGAIASLAGPSTGPLMPFGYSAFRHVAYAVTDGSSHFLKFWQSGQNSSRVFTYDAPISVGTTNATATYADIDLTNFVPLVDNLVVSIAYNFSPNADGDSFEMHGANSTGDAVIIYGPVAAKHVGANVNVLAQTKASKPQISYKTAAAITSLTLAVAGFNYNI